MNRRVLLTIVLLLIAGIGLTIGYVTWSARNADLDLSNTVIEDEEVVGQAGDEIPLGNPPSTLMFSSDTTGDWDILLLDSDGTLLNLTEDDSGAQDLFSSFYINGESINFVTNRLNADTLGPAQVNPDGTDLSTPPIVSAILALVRESKFDWDPFWSPNGETVGFVSLREGNLEIYRLPLSEEIDIDNATQLTGDIITRDWFPAWSPDGTQIAFNNNRGGIDNVYVMDAETGEATQLTDTETYSMHPFWSVDGEKLYYILENDALYETGNLTIMEINPDGSEPVELNRVVQVDPVWSPGGTHVAYASNIEGNWHIYVSQADGSNLRRVTNGDANHLFPVWMP